jgi:glycerophosphoryl diester phosphodiesterase
MMVLGAAMRGVRSIEGVVAVPLAHRGLADVGGAPRLAENTLEAFARSAAAGYGCELDVRLAADGVPVVVHDAAIVGVDRSRTRVARMTVDELERVGVPTLRAALDVLRDRPVLIELKQPRPRVGRLEAAVLAAIGEAGRTGADVAIASFNPWTLAWFERNAPGLPRALTVGRVATRTVLSPPVIRWVRPDVLSVTVDLVGRRRVRTLRRERPVLCWTVRGTEDLARIRDLVDNIIFEGVLDASAVAT